MGQTVKQLAKRALPKNTIFNKRFVIELCEGIHFHYRNFRFLWSRDTWYQVCKGCADALQRWIKRGFPSIGNKHIEMCRKTVVPDLSEFICINYNMNLYNRHEGQVYSEGNEFKDDHYIHVKYRDLRIEMSLEEFEIFAQTVKDAQHLLKTLGDKLCA